MAFPVEYLDIEDLGRKLRLPLASGAVVEDTLTAIYARHDNEGKLVVSVETPTLNTGWNLFGTGVRLNPEGECEYVDGQ